MGGGDKWAIVVEWLTVNEVDVLRGGARTGVDLLEHLVDVGVEGLSALALLGLLATARALRGLCGLLAGCCLCHLGLLKGFGLHPAPKKKFGESKKKGF